MPDDFDSESRAFVASLYDAWVAEARLELAHIESEIEVMRQAGRPATAQFLERAFAEPKRAQIASLIKAHEEAIADA